MTWMIYGANGYTGRVAARYTKDVFVDAISEWFSGLSGR